MREVIYLVVSRHKVERMTKRVPDLARGEFPVKVVVTVAETAFREPLLVREIEIVDWREDLDISDVELAQPFITEEEADIIRRRRVARMAELLEQHGYIVTPKEPEEPETGAAPPE